MSAWLQSLCNFPITILPYIAFLSYKAEGHSCLRSTQMTSANLGLTFGQQPLELIHLLCKPVLVLIGWYPTWTDYQTLSVSSLSHHCTTKVSPTDLRVAKGFYSTIQTPLSAKLIDKTQRCLHLTLTLCFSRLWWPLFSENRPQLACGSNHCTDDQKC